MIEDRISVSITPSRAYALLELAATRISTITETELPHAVAAGQYDKAGFLAHDVETLSLAIEDLRRALNGTRYSD